MLRIPGTGKYVLIAVMCVCSCTMSGCVQSIWYLADDSRLPKWITLSPGLTREDVYVVQEAMEPTRRGVGVKVILYTNKYKKLREVGGNSFSLSGRYFVDVVDGVPEIIGLTHHRNERGIDWPYFFVVDDPALKRTLLDENEWKLRSDSGLDSSAVRKALLDANSAPENQLR